VFVSGTAFCQVDTPAEQKSIENPLLVPEEAGQVEAEAWSQRVRAQEYKAQEIFNKAERLEREGRHDEAQRLREKGEALVAEIDQMVQSRELEVAERRLKALRREAQAAEKRGDPGAAKRLLAEAEAQEREIGAARKEWNLERRIKAHEFRIQELLTAAVHLEEQGREDEAEQMRAKAKAMTRELEAKIQAIETARFTQAAQKVAELRRRACEAEEFGDREEAKLYRAQAVEVERWLDESRRERRFAAEIDEREREIDRLRSQAERLADEGERAEAEELRLRADALAVDLSREIDRREQLRLNDVVRQLEARRAEALEADARGDRERAEDILAEVIELEAMLEEERIERDLHGRIGAFEHAMAAFHEAARDAERSGDVERAAALRHKARDLEADQQELVRKAERRTWDIELEGLHRIGKREECAGRSEAARRAFRKAQELARQLQQMGRRDQQHSAEELLAREIAELRQEIDHLRRELKRFSRKDLAGAGPAVPVDRVAARVRNHAKVRKVLDEQDAHLVLGETFLRQKRIWIFHIRRSELEPPLGRVIVDEKGGVLEIELPRKEQDGKEL